MNSVQHLRRQVELIRRRLDEGKPVPASMWGRARTFTNAIRGEHERIRFTIFSGISGSST